MSNNPLIPSADEPPKNPAVEIIRSKVSRAYREEPAASDELAEAQAARPLSKHQQYMLQLSQSGSSLADIQVAWHEYYATLPDTEKYEVWQEFYDANQHTPYQKLLHQQYHAPETTPTDTLKPTPLSPSKNGIVVADHTPLHPEPTANTAAVHKLKSKIANTVSANGKLKAKHHLQSLGFGLACGFAVLILFLFTFFNDYIIAPFIQPSRTVTNAPIILGNSTVSADAPPSVTVPKINIQIPLNFTVSSYDETEVENGLKSGVVHYPNTAMPGQNGNAAYFGHSSGNIFNNGKYKFAFTLLHDVTTGDLFYITYGGKTYAYRVFEREIVPPSQVSVIHDTKGKTATATLITCDPPGLSTNRLVVWGEQISPAVSTNTPATTDTSSGAEPAQLADNGPTLWNRFVDWVTFWN